MVIFGKVNLQSTSIYLSSNVEDDQVNRSFDRVFMLAPAEPNSRNVKEGWPAVIINDQCNIRPYTGPSIPPLEKNVVKSVITIAPVVSLLILGFY